MLVSARLYIEGAPNSRLAATNGKTEAMRKWNWTTWLLILSLIWVLKQFLPPVSLPKLMSDRQLFELFCEGVLVFLWMIVWDLNAIRNKLEK
jgi:hypothetical protein